MEYFITLLLLMFHYAKYIFAALVLFIGFRAMKFESDGDDNYDGLVRFIGQFLTLLSICVLIENYYE